MQFLVGNLIDLLTKHDRDRAVCVSVDVLSVDPIHHRRVHCNELVGVALDAAERDVILSVAGDWNYESTKKPFAWKDISSHSQDAKDRTPNAWECRPGVFRLIVRRSRYFAPDAWVTTCPGVFDARPLISKELDAAKSEAVFLFTGYLAEAANAFEPEHPVPEFPDDEDE